MNNKLYEQVEKEYQLWYNSIRQVRDQKRNLVEKVFPNSNDFRIDLIYRNMQLESSLFLWDSLSIDVITNDWILWKEKIRNIKKVFKNDINIIDFQSIREDIIQHNTIYWIWITVVDWFDLETNTPIEHSIDPLSVIPDPKNWRWNTMRFFWVERRVDKKELENQDWYINIDKILTDKDKELDKNELAYNDDSNIRTLPDDNLVDIYDHYTIFNWKKVLTTWANNRTLLIRYIELEDLTKQKYINFNKIEFPVKLHRRKPKYNSFFWVSIVDEVWKYQDIITELTKLQTLQARISALWPDKFIDSWLGVNMDLLWKKKPWGRYIPVNSNWNLWNSIYVDEQPNPSQFPNFMKQELDNYSQRMTWVSDMQFWFSMPWQQTLWEIKTLQANANTVLSYIWQNYLRWLKDFWYEHYKQYVLYFKWKKRIALFDKWEPLTLQLTRQDFVSDGKIYLEIRSEQDLKKQKEQDFNKLMAVAQVYLQNMKPWYWFRSFLRKIWDLSWITNFIPEQYIEFTPDEERALMYLEWLNRNEEAPAPKEWEDYKTYLDIYSQALDTDAKFKAITQYKQAYILSWQAQQQWQQQQNKPEAVKSVWAMAMNQLAQQQWQQPLSNEQVKQWV